MAPQNKEAFELMLNFNHNTVSINVVHPALQAIGFDLSLFQTSLRSSLDALVVLPQRNPLSGVALVGRISPQMNALRHQADQEPMDLH